MNDSEELLTAIYEATLQPHGDEEFRAVNSLVGPADATRDPEVMFEVRMALVTAAVFSGRSPIALPAFAWCLQRFREDRKQFSDQEYQLLWRFKWVVGAATDTHAVSLDKFHQLCQQMAELYHECGYGLRAVYYKNFTNAVSCGDVDRAAAAYEEFLDAPRDGMSDCAACEPDNIVEYFDLIDEPEKAIAAAKPIIENKLACAEVPERTYPKLLRSFAMLSRYEEGDRYEKNSYRAIKRQRNFLNFFGLHIAYLIHREKIDEAVLVFEENCHLLAASYEPLANLEFLSAAQVLVDTMDSIGDRRRFSLAPSFADQCEAGDGSFTDVSQQISRARLDLATKFDERNDSRFMSEDYVRRLRY